MMLASSSRPELDILYIPFLYLTRRLDSESGSTHGIPLTAVAVLIPVVAHRTSTLPLERAVPWVHFSQGFPYRRKQMRVKISLITSLKFLNLLFYLLALLDWQMQNHSC